MDFLTLCYMGTCRLRIIKWFVLYVSFKAIETALDCLKSANTEPYYRRQAWEVIKCFLVAMTSLDDNKHALYQLLSHPKSVKHLSSGCGMCLDCLVIVVF